MTVEIRELVIQARVAPATPNNPAEQQTRSLVQESLDEAAWVDRIKREVLAALRDGEGWRP
ncbi:MULTISPECIES: DUF5908 family protein [Yersinia pseudotuberculosis complex]|uniref:Uncharacterized protein n=1 Tax=Yersinia similis TaxID=367190 RepID=A0A0T9QV25_9GAMM|nr:MULTISPECIES: DUF5908 family protein [Yersinia pseudotuberculosis complex]AHK18474.1 hypothetical protein BF17_03275 [Yersinia similis]CFQ67655.1 Uncharacterised protein [Yersinia similis]CNC08901.1 Uncharacterised protein [Yersinia similis]CND36009.1 Uncharacterised protein [Yersinia pseudotuberculosis]CNF47580.1 Uncharacterised protein [Yersinia similis]